MKALPGKAFNFQLSDVDNRIRRTNLIHAHQAPPEQRNYIVYSPGNGTPQFSVGCDKMTKELFQKLKERQIIKNRLVRRSLPKIREKLMSSSSRQCKRLEFVRTRSPVLKRQLQSLSPNRVQIRFKDQNSTELVQSYLPFYWTDLMKTKKEQKDFRKSQDITAEPLSTDRSTSQSKFIRKRMKKLVPFIPAVQTLTDQF